MAQTFAPAAPRGRGAIVAGLIGLALLYVVGLDQGVLLSVVQGDMAFDQNLIHELVHDARHSAAFPCH
jgi:cobalt transporter subunit CbtB